MIIDDILVWVQKLPYWQQLISEKILQESQIQEEFLNEIYSIFKQENELLNQSLIEEKIIFPVKAKKTTTDTAIKWKGLGNVSGVNALKSNETLEIGNQLTLVYGENGSGKSGYTRILNNIFISRGDKNILPNIFKDNQQDTPSAKIFFQGGDGTSEELLFPEDRDHSYCKKISVFDSTSALNDLTKESELNFAPIEFQFFDQLLQFTNEIKKTLEKEIDGRTLDNDFPNYFDKNTSIKNLLSKLDGNTDINEFMLQVKITEEDTDFYNEKAKRKVQLQALNLEGKLSEYNKLISNIEDMKVKTKILNEQFDSERLSKMKELLSEREAYRILSFKEGLEQFENEKIENLGSAEWKEFIVAAQKYYLSIGKEINYCMFCKQDLDGNEVIDKYWKYLQSSAEKKSNDLNRNIKKTQDNFSTLDYEILTKGTKIYDWLQENQITLFETLIDSEQKFKLLKEKIVQSLQTYIWAPEIEELSLDIEIFNSAITLLNEKISSLDSEKVKREINEIQSFEDEYLDKLKVEKLIPKIKIFILNSLWVGLANKKKISTRQITLYQNQLFSKYVTTEYVSKFNEECIKLKANFSAEISQRGSKGTTLNKLTVKGKKTVEILSEGEQRSIALANFLAETSLHNENICVIFDDPVSSLDYKRREVISNRLVEEAKKKQVVILTHDLTFSLSIQNRCSDQKVDCISTTIRKIQKTTGIIDNSIPWIGMPVKQRIAHLKNKLQQIEKDYKTITPESIETYHEYHELVKRWCGDLRETWERTIEEILFNNSVQRFSPAIQTQRLKSATFTTALYDEIEKGMGNCSNWVHDRASGLGEDIPSLDDLKKYLIECETFIKNNRPK